MTAKFDPADHRQRGSIAGVQDPSLARAHVSGSLSLGLENGPRGRTSGVGEEPSGHAYRWPPLSQLREQELSVAYTAITGRRAFRGPMRLLIVAARLHGPDTVDLLRELYQDGGAQDLLKRLIAYPPRLAPHPDYTSEFDVVELPANRPENQRPSGAELDPLPQALIEDAGDPVCHPEADQVLESWRCWADLGSGHVPALRADGSVYCATCHP